MFHVLGHFGNYKSEIRKVIMTAITMKIGHSRITHGYTMEAAGCDTARLHGATDR